MTSKRHTRLYDFLLTAIMILLSGSASIQASKVTIDSDGGADYRTLDAVLAAIEANSIDPDTIEFIGNDQDSYDWSTTMSRDNVGTLVLRSTQTSPNLFPIINKTGDRCWNFINNTNIYFENFIIPNGRSTTGTDPYYAWSNSQSDGKTLSFKRCIIRDESEDYFLKMEGGTDNTVIIENCLFEGNAKIFTFDYWSGSPTILITNCTFDNNTELFSSDLYIDRAANVSIKNCIFSNNATTFPSGDVLKGKTTYSLTSEATTGYGTGCVSNSNPRYVSASRTNPGDWIIQSISPALNLGTSFGAPLIDISGYARNGNPDAGCWEMQNLDYTWDISTASGIQAGSGIWGTNNFWTLTSGNGRALVAWSGFNNSATFAGSDGTYTITVNGPQNVDSITFSSSGYTLSGSTAINFLSKKGVYVASGKSAVIATPMSGTDGMTFSGGGTLTSSGTNTYTGATTVSDGTLLVTGSIASGSPVTVGIDATLGGTGIIGGLITAHGTISPGTTGAGILTIGNSLTFTNNGSLHASLNGTTAGSDYDQIVMNAGTVTLENAALSLTLGFSPVAGNTFTIIDNIGSNPVNGTFNGLPQGATFDLSYGGTAYRFSISYSGGTGNDVVLTMSAVLVPDDYNTWNYQQTMILNTTSTGADVAGDVTDFPVLVRLNPGNFSHFSQTLPGGADIRFSKTDGTHIPYKIERWIDHTGNNDTADIWVKLDTVYGNNSTQAFKMYWGKSGAIDSSSGRAVFDTANGFAAVYFLDQASGSAIDYTSNSLNGSAHGSVPDRHSGMIGFSQSFNGNGDYFDAGNSSKFDMSADDKLTISAWVKPAGDAVAGSIEGIAAKWQWDAGSYAEYELCESSTQGFFFAISSNGSNFEILNDVNGVPTNGTWYHVAGTMDGSKMILFVNGMPNDSSTAMSSVYHTTNGQFRIGLNDDDGGSFQGYYNGTIDHVTLSKTNRSASWIKLSYENQKSDQSLIGYPGDYTWDNATASGIQSGSGTWGTDPYWTYSGGDGTLLVPWLGTGNSATFAGTDGDYTITVNGTQAVDSMTFLNATYSFSNGMIDFGTGNGIYVAAGKNAVFGSVIDGSGGLSKYGGGTLTMSTTNIYTGPTIISSGTFLVNGSIATGSVVTVGSGGTLGGTGFCNGPVTVNGGTIAPGVSVPGKLSMAALTLDAASLLNFDLGTQSDTIAVTGALTLDGTINFSAAAGFSEGTYRLITYSGNLTDNMLDIGSWPAGMDYKLTAGDGYVDVVVTMGLIKEEPKDTVTLPGRSVSFSVTATGMGTLVYKWLRFPDDSVGNAATLSLTADTTARFRCVVRDSVGIDSSRWALCTVIDTPRVNIQPENTSVTVGENVIFSLKVDDTTMVTYAWMKAGNTTVLSTTDSLTLNAVTFSDSGGYYCLVTNPAAITTTDTARLTVIHTIPIINTQPVAVNALLDNRVEFTIDVDTTGNASPSFAWKKIGSDAILSETSSYVIPSVAFSDTGDYYCIVSNPGGSISSDTVHLAVKFPPPKAAFSFLPKSGLIPLTVDFTDSSTDSITSRLWRFGDDSTSTETSPTHIYTNAGRYTVTLIVNGPGGTDSMVKYDSVFAYTEGANPVRMTARFLSGTDVELTLIGVNSIDTAPPTPDCDSLGIWIRPESLPVNSLDDSLIVTYPQSIASQTTIIDTITLPTTDSLYGLMSGLFWNDGTISDFTDINGCMVFLRKTPENPCTLSATATSPVSVDLSWNNITDKSINNARIWYGTSIIKTGLFLPDTDFTSVEVLPADTSTRISDLTPSTTYYFAIQVAEEPYWSTITENSRTTCRTLDTITGWQVVTFFDSLKTNDTVVAFNNHILLWKDSTYTAKTVTDTLEVISFDTMPNGMIVVGIPFLFKIGDALDTFSIGIRIDSLPDNTSLNDVRIYRDSTDGYVVNYETVVDSAHGIVSINTDDLRYPFIAMIDTSPPKVTIYSDTASVVHSTEKLTDSLRIDDNIVNVRWKYFYGKGADVPELREQEELRSISSNFSLIISDTARVISSESGFRAILEISDGVHVDTINLSRSVFRHESDNLTIKKKIWTPFYPTAVLNDKSSESLVARLLKKFDAKSYNTHLMRLYQWVNFADNADDSDKWIEYNPDRNDIRSLFTLEPGRMIWLKTRDNISFHLDSGYTLPLKDTFSVDLPPKQWSDFGMPYRFGVRMEEILSASGMSSDSVLFYIWKMDSIDKKCYLYPYYVRGMPDKFDRSQTIDYLPREGYCLYNQSSKTVLMRIPPILPAMGKELTPLAKKSSLSWSTKFIVQSPAGTRLPAVYFGYAPGIKKNNYPLTPSFTSLRLTVYDRKTKLRYGHYIDEDAKEGLVKELMISNDADTIQTIRYRFEKTGAFPENYAAFCFDAAVKTLDTNGTIAVPAKSIASRWIVTGDAAYRNRFLSSIMQMRYSLHPLYPNPSRSVVIIRYTVPFGAQERIRVAIYNILGKQVWKKEIHTLLTEGSHIITWNGRDAHGNAVGSGFYIVQLDVVNSRGKIVKRFNRRVTWLK